MSEDRRRLSFDSVAEAYERGRPPYAQAVLAWIAERLHMGRVLWFRVEEALVEMHRVLRPHGGVALLWKPWAEEDGVLHAVDEMVQRRAGGPRSENWRDRFDPALFGPIEERTFREVCELTTDSLVDWVASTSTVALASADERACIEAEVRELAGAGPVVVSLATDVVVFDRV